MYVRCLVPILKAIYMLDHLKLSVSIMLRCSVIHQFWIVDLLFCSGFYTQTDNGFFFYQSYWLFVDYFDNTTTVNILLWQSYWLLGFTNEDVVCHEIKLKVEDDIFACFFWVNMLSHGFWLHVTIKSQNNKCKSCWKALHVQFRSFISRWVSPKISYIF